MPHTIRARLLLLMLTVLLPAIAAALVVVARTWQSEREGLQRSLRSSALAMAQVIDREVARRQDIAEALATSHLMMHEPEDDPDLLFLHAWTSRIARELGGWIELRSDTHVLMDTRSPAGSRPRPLVGGDATLHTVATVLPLVAVPSAGQPGGMRPPQVVQPVRRPDGRLLNLVMVLPPDMLQRVIDQQHMPAGWVGTVVDNGLHVVARQPGGPAFLGREVTPDMRARVSSESEGAFTSVTLDGMPAVGHFSRTPQGWIYMNAAPREALVGDMPAAVFQVVAGALLLLAAATGAALWVSRGIAGAAESLKDAALALQAGAPTLPQRPTGIAEFDEVGHTLAVAGRALANARQDLEAQVADAVARTRQAEQRASRGQRIAALGRLTGGVAHDFNNLLGVISNSAHLVEQHVAQVPALQMPVAVTLRAVEMGSHLSQQLLRFGGRQPVSPRPVDLAAYLPELRELLQMVMRKAIPVAVEVQPGTAPVKIDTSELELALINVALNARDAMPDGGRLRVLARNARPDEAEGLAGERHVLIAVSDTGTGMDENLAAQVFEPFFTTKGLGQGTGLGLSQVHGFCAQAGGSARMASTPGLGSTVSLVLPACTDSPASAVQDQPAAGPGRQAAAGAGAGAGLHGLHGLHGAQGMQARPGDGDSPPKADAATGAPTSPPLLHGASVLLVEDSEELAEVTVMLLQSYGCRVRRARHVDDALAQVQADPTLQLVLTDVVMPGARDGVDLARELRRTRPQLPVVLISGYSAALTGLTGFTVLRKPVAAEQLVRTLAAALRGESPAVKTET